MSSKAGPSTTSASGSGRNRKAPERLIPAISWKELDASGYADDDGEGGDDDDDEDDSGEDFSEEDDSGSDSDYNDPDGVKGGNLDDDDDDVQEQVQQSGAMPYQNGQQQVRGIWRDKLVSRLEDEGEQEGPAGDEFAEVEPGGKEAISGLLARVQGDEEAPTSQRWEADAAAFQNDLRHNAGFKTAKKEGPGRGRGRARVELSGEVKKLMGDATLAFVEAREREAIKILEEIIQIEPGALQAWTLLRNCFLELEEEYKAIQVGIIVALMSSRPNALWRDLAADSKEKELYQQALFCYQEAIKADRKDLLSMWERGELLEGLGQYKKAAEQFNVMWKLNLYDGEIRDKIIENWMAAEEYQRVINFSSDCFEHAKRFFPKGDLRVPDRNKININAIRGNLPLDHARALLANGNYYSIHQIHTLAEAYLWTHRYDEAIDTIRQGTRWIQGRGHEKFWDELEDDREFDDDREDPNGGKRDGKKGRAIDRAPVHPLDDDLRLSLGRARLSSGELKEGKRHFDILTAGVDPDQHSDRFVDIANQYIEAQMWDEAILLINALLKSDEQTHRHHHVENYSRLASAYYAKGDLKAAVSYYESIVDTEKEDLTSKLRLAEILEELGDRYRALQLVNEVVRTRQALQQAENNATDTSLAQEAAEQSQQQLQSQLSFFDEVNITSNQSGQKPRKSSSSKSGVRKMTTTQRQKLEKQREEQVQDMWSSLRLQGELVFSDDWWHRDVILDGELTEEEEMRAREALASREDFSQPEDEEEQASLDRAKRIVATREWMETAHTLVEGFRGTRALFPRDRTSKFKGVVRTFRKRKRKDLDSQATELMSRIQDRMYNEAGEDLEEEEEVVSKEHTSFRKVDLDQWIGLFMQYAFVLTRVGDYEAAKEMFNDIIHSNVIHNSEERKLALTLCQASCSLYARDYDALFSLLRALPTTYQFLDEPLRLVAAIGNVTNVYGVKAFSESAHAKIYHRRLRLIETIAAGRYHSFNNLTNRWYRPLNRKPEKARSKSLASAESGSDQEQNQDDSEIEEEEEAFPENDLDPMGAPTASERLARRRYGYPDKNSPIGEIFYGSILLMGRSYNSALSYFLRAYAREPQDALTCLMVATTCLGRVIPREVDNRNHLVLQGMTFMSLYRDAREGSNQETEYNFGRAFHHLGLLHLAVPHYEKVLRLQEEASSKGVDTVNAGFAMYKEAAYNLSLIYMTSGNASLARSLHEKWLTL